MIERSNGNREWLWLNWNDLYNYRRLYYVLEQLERIAVAIFSSFIESMLTLIEHNLCWQKLIFALARRCSLYFQLYFPLNLHIAQRPILTTGSEKAPKQSKIFFFYKLFNSFTLCSAHSAHSNLPLNMVFAHLNHDMVLVIVERTRKQ